MFYLIVEIDQLPIVCRYYGSMYQDQRRPGAPPLQNIKEEPQTLHENMGDKDMYSGMLQLLSFLIFNSK